MNSGTDMEEKDNIRRDSFHSDEVQDIMGRKPAWMLRWGITVIVVILAGIITACWFIRYPRTVTGAVTVTSDNPPAALAAKATGILERVCVGDGDTVERGTLIALIASSAIYDDMCRAERVLETLGDSSVSLSDSTIAAGYGYGLGEVQNSWTALLAACSDYNDYRRIDPSGKRLKVLEGQSWRQREYYAKLERQRRILEEELECERATLERDSMLMARKVLSQADYENTLKSYIAKKNSLAGFDATMSSANVARLQIEQQIVETRTSMSTQEADYVRTINRSARTVASEMASWKERYAIIAPCAGTVSMQNVWSAGQHVNAGDMIAGISPGTTSPVIGRAKVPSSGFGKVKEGQEVNIKLSGFPYLEFGMLRGRVRSISQVPERTSDGLFYTVELSLPGGLESTYHKTLPFVQDMDGTAEIITEDMRLLEQFIQPIRSLFTNSL